MRSMYGLLFGSLSLSSLSLVIATHRVACSVDSLAGVLPSSASIVSAVFLPKGNTYGEGSADIAYPTNPTNLPELCAIIVNVTSSPISSYRIGLFLPTAWNSRFLAVGNGGFLGGINWLDMGSGVRYGHAVVSTDTGHNSTIGDASWALNNAEKKKDFGYRAIHGSVVLGKQLVEAYYGMSIKYSYYSGGSTGGRQGLKEAEISPDSFDGMVIGAPAWWTSHLQPWTTKIATYNLPASADNPKHIPATLFSTIGAEVIKQCDTLDGVADGIVTYTNQCTVNFTSLLCANHEGGGNGSSTDQSSACLTSSQLPTLAAFYADYIANGTFAFPGMEYSSEAQWDPLLGGPAPSTLGDGYMQYFLFNDPAWNYTLYNDSIVWQADRQDPGNCTADNYRGLAAYRDHGGKVLLYHGLADGLIVPGSSRVFYERVANALGAGNGVGTSIEALQPWFRFFQVPGMQHVVGTAVDAPWYFAGPNAAGTLGTDVYSTPGFEDTEHDALLAVMAWVEKGEAVDHLVATTWNQQTVPKSGVLRQRPLCPWPKKQVWDGRGDPNKAGSFSCE